MEKDGIPIGPLLKWAAAVVRGDESTFYESDPAGYEAVVRLSHGRQAVADGIAKLVRDQFNGKDSPRRYLDTACGTGLIIDALAKDAAPGAELIGLDLSQPSLDFARGTKDPRIQWKQGSYLELDGIEDGSVDVYTMVAGYRHISDHQRFYEAIKRVLSDRGIAIIPQHFPGDMGSADLLQAQRITTDLGLTPRVQRTNFQGLIPRLCVQRALILGQAS